jgi:MFS family permease
MLWVGALANIVALGAIPAWATLSDRIGRRPVFLIGAAGSAVLMFAYLWAISTGSYPLVLLFGILAFGVVYSAANGVWPSFYGEMFSTRVRLSGMAIGTQIGFAVAARAATTGRPWPCSPRRCASRRCSPRSPPARRTRCRRRNWASGRPRTPRSARP